MGTAVFTAVRFNGDGTLDTSFNHIGAVIAPHGPSANDYFAQRAAAGGQQIVGFATSTVNAADDVAGALPAGRSLDPGFGEGGRVLLGDTSGTRIDTARRLGLQSSGRLLVAATEYDKVADNAHALVTAVDRTGARDARRPSARTAPWSWTSAQGQWCGVDRRPLVQPDDKVLILFRLTAAATGNASYAIMRLHANGARRFVRHERPVVSARLPVRIVDGASSRTAASSWPVRGSGAPRLGEVAVARYSLGPSRVIEYYHAALDHYFITMNPQEVKDLDTASTATGSAPASPSPRTAPSATPAGFMCRSAVSTFHRRTATRISSPHSRPNASGARAHGDRSQPAGVRVRVAERVLGRAADAVTGAPALADTAPVYLINGTSAPIPIIVTSRARRSRRRCSPAATSPEGFGPQAVAVLRARSSEPAGASAYENAGAGAQPLAKGDEGAARR